MFKIGIRIDYISHCQVEMVAYPTRVHPQSILVLGVVDNWGLSNCPTVSDWAQALISIDQFHTASLVESNVRIRGGAKMEPSRIVN